MRDFLSFELSAGLLTAKLFINLSCVLKDETGGRFATYTQRVLLNRDFYRFQTRPWCQGLHILTTEKRRCGSRQRVAASELDVGTVVELSGVADLLVDVETSRIPPHADARQSFRAPPRRIAPLESCAAPRRAKKNWKSWSWTSSRLRGARHAGRS